MPEWRQWQHRLPHLPGSWQHGLSVIPELCPGRILVRWGWLPVPEWQQQHCGLPVLIEPWSGAILVRWGQVLGQVVHSLTQLTQRLDCKDSACWGVCAVQRKIAKVCRYLPWSDRSKKWSLCSLLPGQELSPKQSLTGPLAETN